MKISVFHFSLMATIFTALAYITSGNIYLATIIGSLYWGYFIGYLPKKLHAFFSWHQREQEGFRFINVFIIALSVKKTTSGAFEAVMGQISESLKQEIVEANTIDSFQILEYLRTYFPFSLYEMFITIIDLQTNQGGEILSMATLLLATIRRMETDYQEKMLIAKRKLTDFIVLWAMTIVVLLFARFGISSLFETMLASPMFIIGIGVFYMFLLYAIHSWLTRFIKVTNNV